MIADALRPVIADVVTPAEIEAIRQRLTEQPEPSAPALTRHDLAGAAVVCLLVFSSTFPVVIPLFLMRQLSSAMLASNAIALALLFVTGWSLGVHSGRSGWRTGVGTALVGVVLVAITIALGG